MATDVAENERRLGDQFADPLKFVKLCWPELVLYDKQVQILLSVRDNVETFVHAANETGKTCIAAIVALWFFASRTPARVITSASVERQLKEVLWSEINERIRTSRVRFPFVPAYLQCRKRIDGQISPMDYLIGHVTSAVENFQGHHLPHDKPRVLFIGDEASGIADEFKEASESWAHRTLMIGNPLNCTNFFYRMCKEGDIEDPAGGPGLLRKVVHISGDDSPNVKMARRRIAVGLPPGDPIVPGLLSLEEFLRRERVWDPVQQQMRLHGRFYEGELRMMFPPAWLEHAMSRERWEDLNTGDEERKVEAIGVDVAAGGRDKSAWALIDRFGVLSHFVKDTPDTMEVADITMGLIDDHRLAPSRVAMDVGGGGKGVADYMLRKGVKIKTISFAESPGEPGTKRRRRYRETDPKQAYRNRRAEMYGELRDRMRPTEDSFQLPPDAHELRQELAVLPLQFDQEGKLFLPPKDPSRTSQQAGQVSLFSLLGRSPDRADALVLAVHALKMGKAKPVIIDPSKVEPDPKVMAKVQERVAKQLAAMRGKIR